MKCNKTKRITSINEKTMIVAVNIGKYVHHAYFRAPNGEDIEPFRFFNSEIASINSGLRFVSLKNNRDLKMC